MLVGNKPFICAKGIRGSWLTCLVTFLCRQFSATLGSVLGMSSYRERQHGGNSKYPLHPQYIRSASLPVRSRISSGVRSRSPPVSASFAKSVAGQQMTRHDRAQDEIQADPEFSEAVSLLVFAFLSQSANLAQELLAMCASLDESDQPRQSSAEARRARRQQIMAKYSAPDSLDHHAQMKLPPAKAASKAIAKVTPQVAAVSAPALQADLAGHDSDGSEDMFATDAADDVAALAAAGVLAHADTTAAAVAKRSEEVESHSVTARASAGNSQGAMHLQDNFDDAEGFLRTRVGESLGGRYTVQGSTGRGVFGAVCFCIDNQPPSAAAAHVGLLGPSHNPAAQSNTSSLVAVKVLRANDTMRKAGEKEIETLQAIQKVDPNGTGYVIRMMRWFEHHGHLCLVFEPMHMNLKEVQDKFGRGVGIAIDAVALYTRQLLQGLRTVHKAGFIHADIKPQNILANETFNVVKVADLGSAFGERSADNVATPILVSRFYRAPEIILGLVHTPALDVWALACVLYEMYTGDILFQGEDNNDMLHRMQCLRGRFPNKLVRKHLAAVSALEIESHFDEDNKFIHLEVDPVTKAKVARHVVVPLKPEISLHDRLFAQRASTDSQKQVSLFKDLLERMLVADPARRIKVHEALKHPFLSK